MTKELEKSITWLSNVNNFGNVSRYSKEYFKHFNKVVEALTPPTADEVIKALSEYSKTNVYYERGGFFYRNEYRYNQPFLVAIKYKSGLIEITKNVLPPHLITMIGKFYESLVGEKNDKRKRD